MDQHTQKWRELLLGQAIVLLALPVRVDWLFHKYYFHENMFLLYIYIYDGIIFLLYCVGCKKKNYKTDFRCCNKGRVKQDVTDKHDFIFIQYKITYS